MTRLLLLLLASLAPSVCYADNVLVTITGGFHPFAPTSAFTGPSTPFQIQFETDGVPLPGISINASDFAVSTTIRYKLGAVETSYASQLVGFYDNSGGLYMELPNGAMSFEFSLGGPVLFSGTPANPTLPTGSFLFGEDMYTFYRLEGLYYGFGQGITVTVTDASQALPEPSEVLMSAGALSLALLAASGRARR